MLKNVAAFGGCLMLYGPDDKPISVAVRRPGDRRSSQAMSLLASVRDDAMRRLVDEWRAEASGRIPIALPPQETLLANAYYMYYLSGLYGGIVEKKTGIICGDGFGWSAKRPKVRKIIKGFWRDRVNALNRRIRQISDELCAFGEVFLLQYVQRSTGRLRIGRVMPWNVERVITDPDNPECPIGIKVWNTNVTIPILMGPDTPQYERRNFSAKARELRRGFTPLKQAEGLRGCLYYYVNPRLTDEGSGEYGPELRGTSDLLAATPTVQDAEDVLKDGNERMRLGNRMLYDVTIQGADDDAIDAFNAKIEEMPDAYAFFTHNERVTANMQTPDFKTHQTRESFETARNAAISAKGAGQPPTWWAEGTLTTKASAESMPFPTLKIAKDRQQFLGEILTEVTAYQLFVKSAISAEQFDTLDTEGVFALEYPTISEKDMEMLMRVQTGLTSTLNVGVSNRWISDEEAARAYRAGLMEATGVELDEYQPPTPEDDIRSALRGL